MTAFRDSGPPPGADAADTHRPAVVVITDLVVLAKHLRLLDAAGRRGLTPLFVFGPETPADELARHRRDPHHPLSRLADDQVRHLTDTSLDTLLHGVAPWLRDRQVRAVLNVGEVFVEAAGALARTLGLPGPGTHAARVCRNKLLQRLAAPALAPRWTLLDPARTTAPEGWDTFPAVLKPASRMSSSGVRAITGPHALPPLLPGYGPGELLLLEERIAGAEFSVESLVRDGVVLWAGITAKDTNESDTSFFTETGHTSPAPHLTPAQESLLLDANTEFLRAVDFGTGMSHTEFRLTAGNRVVLMEAAARPPGDAITRLWRLATGMDLDAALLDLALGTEPATAPPRRRARQVYLDHPRGLLADVTAETAPVHWVSEQGGWPDLPPAAQGAPPRDHAVLVSRHRGDLLGDQSDSQGRSVSVVLDGPLDADLDHAAHEAARRVTIHTVPPAAAPDTPAATPAPTGEAVR
ncbi:acetyl-CoA carboxylase biotin carboxylase subunit family protein [Streptomyces sp. NPDC058294]|uniref:ATP-grasp domain-containing protein n=1 Tax=Streptomyces sp. NPDC058294 TaxID=3346430 RepID=UPI0036EB9055